VAAILAIGALAWRRFLRRHPLSLHAAVDGRLELQWADGCRQPVLAVRRGVVRPWLVSATLRTPSGRVDLFAPGWSMPRPAHWRLRRALTGFRAPPAD
jgi:hypothetical protein